MHGSFLMCFASDHICMSVNMYDALSFITVTVKRKFEIPDEETLKYVLNGDAAKLTEMTYWTCYQYPSLWSYYAPHKCGLR